MNTGIQLALNFDLKAPLPLDQRLSVNTTSELNSIPNPYSGMQVYSADTQTIYYLKNIINDQKTWSLFPSADQFVGITGDQSISGIKNFDTYPMVNVQGEMKRVITQGDQSLGGLVGIPNFPQNAVYNDNILMNCNASGYLTGVGYSGNYDGGYFFGRTKITQNTTRIVETGIGENFIPVTETSAVNGVPFSGAWRWLSCSSDAKYITASRDTNYLYSSNDFGKSWYPTAKDFGNRNWRGISMSADGKYQVAVSTYLVGVNGLVIVSKDYGISWTAKFNDTNDWVAPAVSSDGKYITVAYSNGAASEVYIYRSINYGESFTLVGPIANNVQIQTLRFITMSSDGKYQTIVASKYILASSDYGQTWRQAYVSTTNTPFFSVSMSTDGRFQIVTTSGGSAYDGEVYASNDYGFNWKSIKNFGRNIPLTSISNSDHGRLSVMTMKNGFILTSNDYGNNWKIKTTKQNNTTTLTSAISDTTAASININVLSSAGMFVGNTTGGSNFLLIDNEVFYITAINGNAVTVTRAYAGTAASTHANGATVILSNDWRRTAMSNDGKTLIACDNNYGDPATNTKGGYIYISTTDEKVDGNFYADNLVYNVGDQNISGVKNFISRPQFGGTNLATTADVAGGTITDYVNLTTPQNIAGVKNFSSRPQFNTADLATVSQIPTNTTYVDMTTNQTVVGVKNFSSRPQFNSADLATTSQIPTNLTYVDLASTQTIQGDKTFSNTPKVLVAGVSKALAIKNETVDLTTTQTVAGVKNFSSRPQFNTADLATVSQIPTNTTYVDMTTNQTVAGVKNFSSRPQFGGTDLALITEAGGGAAITDYVKLTTAQTIAGLKTFSDGVISSVGITGTNLVYNTGDQTIAGIKDFSSRPKYNGTQLPIASDIPTNTTYVDVTNAQTVNGLKTFGNVPKVLVASVSKTLALKEDVVDMTTAQTVAGVKNFSSRPQFNSADLATTSQIPTNSTYVDMTTAQTVAGIKTFSSVPIFSAGADFNGGKIANAVPEVLQLSASFTLDSTHNGKIIMVSTAAGPITITTPASTPIVGYNVSIIQVGASAAVTIAPGSGATLLSFNNQYKTAGLYAAISIVHWGANQLIMYGNTTA